jgi:uncharacterized protein (TIGR00730 family)
MNPNNKNGIENNHFCVVIFGSARIEPGDPNWHLIYDLAKRIAQEGIHLVTGGGPGLMDAASIGHYAGDINRKAHSIGLKIKLPKEDIVSDHLDIRKDFSHFSTRLDNFMELANVVIVAPGGVGTLLELFYTWQLMQVKMIKHIPIILLGEMWSDFLLWIKKWLLKNKFLEQKDVDLLHLVENNEDAFSIIKQEYMSNSERVHKF